MKISANILVHVQRLSNCPLYQAELINSYAQIERDVASIRQLRVQALKDFENRIYSLQTEIDLCQKQCDHPDIEYQYGPDGTDKTCRICSKYLTGK